MKLSFFIGSLTRAGSERVLSILANHYAEMGHEVDIVLLMDDEVGYELNDRINLVNLTGKNKGRVLNIPFWLRGIRRYINERNPDRVVAFMVRINVLVLLASLGMKTLVTVSERNDPKNDGRSRLMLGICNVIYRAADSIVFQTRYEKSCFTSKLKNKGYIIPNPVCVQDRNKPSAKTRIVTAGRLQPQKNQSMLIDAARVLKNRGITFSIDIYGEGSLEDELRNKIAEDSLDYVVFLRGNVSDLHKQIADATLFVMTSDYEGLSNSLIEAQMMGFPCISTKYPGANELIEDRVNGLLVECNDSEELANAVQELLEKPDLRVNLGNNALKASEKYTYKVVLEKWDEVILRQ